jgi:hypothetical protein
MFLILQPQFGFTAEVMGIIRIGTVKRVMISSKGWTWAWAARSSEAHSGQIQTHSE